MEFVKDQMSKGKAIPSLVSTLLESNLDPKDEYIVRLTGVSMYGGGADTVSPACSREDLGLGQQGITYILTYLGYLDCICVVFFLPCYDALP